MTTSTQTSKISASLMFWLLTQWETEMHSIWESKEKNVIIDLLKDIIFNLKNAILYYKQ